MNCAKENNKENVVGSKTPCKGEKLSRVNERMARAAGVVLMWVNAYALLTWMKL